MFRQITQFCRINGLEKKTIHTGLKRPFAAFILLIGSQGKDHNRFCRTVLQFPFQLANAGSGRVAITDRHVHVHQDHFVRLGILVLQGRFEKCYRLIAVEGASDPDVAFLQGRCHQQGVDVIVFDQQQFAAVK